MNDPMVDWALYLLLVASLAASCCLILLSAAMVGRKLADIAYQRAAGLNGTIRIQGVINVRTHLMRVVVGVTFAVFSVLLLADAPMLWRQWVNRLLFVLVPAGYVAAGILDWLAEQQQMRLEMAEAANARAAAALLAATDDERRYAGMVADLASYRQMVAEAIEHLEAIANRSRADAGHPPLETLAPVVPEHQSPTTVRQQETAHIATLRARQAVVNKALGFAPETEP